MPDQSKCPFCGAELKTDLYYYVTCGSHLPCFKRLTKSAVKKLYRLTRDKGDLLDEIAQLKKSLEEKSSQLTISEMRSDTLARERNEYVVLYHQARENQIPGMCKDCRYNQEDPNTGFKHCIQKSTTEVRIAVPDDGFCFSFKERS